MYIEYDDVLAAVDDTDVYSCAQCTAEVDKLEEDILSEFAVYAADYRLEVDQFTTEELIAAAEKFNTQFNITRPDGTVVSYSDLSLSRYSYGMSFGCLYEVLYREGFEVDGTPEHFTYVGIDGCNYEFSYSFNDYVYDNGKPGYYYLKDDEKVPMSYYFYNHFRSGFLQEISGLTFEKI